MRSDTITGQESYERFAKATIAAGFMWGTVGEDDIFGAGFLLGLQVPRLLDPDVERLRADLAVGGVQLLEDDEIQRRDELIAAQTLMDGRHQTAEARRAWARLLAGRNVGPQLRALLVIALIDGAEERPNEVAGSMDRAASDPDWEVRIALAENAWKLGELGRRMLETLVSDPEDDVREAAEESLADDFAG